MNSPRPKVGIIILHWNDYEHSSECVKSVKSLDYSNYQIYLVDNNSSNDSLARLKREFDDINYIELKNNKGFAHGMNAGINTALREKSDFVFILNNDIVVQKKCLELLVRRAICSDKNGIIVPMVYLGTNGKKIGSIGGYLNWKYGEARHFGHLENDNGQFTSKQVEFAPGSALLVKANAINQTGLIPEDYFLYSEDVDWSLKIVSKGYNIITEPKAIVWHDESASSGSQSPLKIFYYTRNTLIFMKKYSKNKQWHRFIIFFSIKLIKLKIKFLLKGQFKLIAAMFYGILAFWHNEKGMSRRFVPGGNRR